MGVHPIFDEIFQAHFPVLSEKPEAATISKAVIASSIAHLAPWQETPHYACYGCDHARPFEVAFCPSCDEQTAGYLVRDECAL